MVRLLKKRQNQRGLTADDSYRGLVTVVEPSNVVSEDYRTLRTSLLYALVDTPPKAIVVTSPSPMEGKSTTCANLGVVLAQANKSVLVVDCDLRRPAIHKIFGLRNLQGLVNVLVDECELQVAYQEPLQGLKALTAGSLPPNPAELLGTRRFSDFLARVREEFDYVLIDTPPIEAVSDPLIVATQGDGVLLVLDAYNTRKSSVRRAVHDLENVGAKVLGTVMNNVKKGKGSYYYRYRYE